MNIDEILFHPGEGEISTDIPTNPPIYQTSNFIFNSLRDMKNALREESEIPFYTRGANPTVLTLQKKIAALEGTEQSMILAVMAQVQAGDHIICVMNPYSWTKKLIANILGRFKVTSDFVDARFLLLLL